MGVQRFINSWRFDYKLWSKCRITFISVNLWRVWITHYLWYVISLNDSENLGKKDLKWIMDACDLQNIGQHLIKNNYDSEMEIHGWSHEHFQTSMSKSHSLQVHPQMHVRNLSFKEEALREHDPEIPAWLRTKWKTVVRCLGIWNSFWKIWHHVLHTDGMGVR